MELRQLKYFVGIVDAGSISRAAESLHVGQPALSLQITHLEEELGVKLFVRTSRGVVPTDQGKLLCHQARKVLSQIETFRMMAAQPDPGPVGVVALGLPGTISSLIGLELLNEIRAHSPGIHLRLTEGPSWFLTEQVSNGKLDLAVLYDATPIKGMVLTRILTEPLMFIGKHGLLAGRTHIDVEEACSLPLVMLSRPNGIREVLEIAWGRRGLQPKVVAEINSPRLLVEAVEAGLGFSILPPYGLDARIRANRLDAIDFNEGAYKRTVSIGTSGQHALSAAAMFVQRHLLMQIRNAVTAGLWPATLVNQQEAGDDPA